MLHFLCQHYYLISIGALTLLIQFIYQKYAKMHIDTIKLLHNCISTYIIIVQNEEYAFQDIYNKVITI
jgi:hypothetical protein